MFRETIAAVDRTVFSGSERNLAGLAAGGADSIVHLALGSAFILAGHTAGFASLGLVGETFFLKEILFAGGEYEFLAAVFAD